MRTPALPPAAIKADGTPAIASTALIGTLSATLCNSASRALTAKDAGGESPAPAPVDNVPRNSPRTSGHASICQDTGKPMPLGSTRNSPAPVQIVPVVLVSRNLPADAASILPSISEAGAVNSNASNSSAVPTANAIVPRMATAPRSFRRGPDRFRPGQSPRIPPRAVSRRAAAPRATAVTRRKSHHRRSPAVGRCRGGRWRSA